MDYQTSDPGPGKKRLREKMYEAKTTRRSGAWTSDQNNPTRGIFPADKATQKVFRKKLNERIKTLRKGIDPDAPQVGNEKSSKTSL